MDPLEIALRIPAQAEYLHITRAVVGAAALRLDLTYEALDDLRLAVDEAATRLLLTPGTHIDVRIIPRGRVIEVRLSTDSAREAFPDEEERTALAWTLMDALVDEVEAGASDGQTWIHLIKHAAA